jgi:hypothetical protein
MALDLNFLKKKYEEMLGGAGNAIMTAGANVQNWLESPTSRVNLPLVDENSLTARTSMVPRPIANMFKSGIETVATETPKTMYDISKSLAAMIQGFRGQDIRPYQPTSTAGKFGQSLADQYVSAQNPLDLIQKQFDTVGNYGPGKMSVPLTNIRLPEFGISESQGARNLSDMIGAFKAPLAATGLSNPMGMLGYTVLGGAMNVGIAPFTTRGTNVIKNFNEGAMNASEKAALMTGGMTATNPYLARLGGLPAQSVGNVVQGIGLDRAAGYETTPESMLLDLIMPGASKLASKATKAALKNVADQINKTGKVDDVTVRQIVSEADKVGIKTNEMEVKQKLEQPQIKETLRVYRGEGGAIQDVLKESGAGAMFGEGKYYATTPEYASKYGKVSAENLDLKSSEILKLDTDAKLDGYVRKAMQAYPEMDGTTAISKLAADEGYKAIEGFDTVNVLNTKQDIETDLPNNITPLTTKEGDIIGYSVEGSKKAPVYKGDNIRPLTKVARIIEKNTAKQVDVPVARQYDPNLITGTWNRIGSSIEGFFNRQGEAGKQFAKVYNLSRREGGTLAGKATVAMTNAINKLSKEDLDNFVEVAEGRMEANTPALKEAVAIWDVIRKDIAQKAADANLNIRRPDGSVIEFTPREGYYPHFIPDEYLKNEALQKTLFEKMVEAGNAKSVAEAKTLFENYMKRNIRRRYGNLEYAREIDLPIYERDPRKVLLSYIDNAYHRVTDAKYFGPRDERAYKVADQISLKGGDGELARKMIDRVFGKEPTDTFANKVSKTATGFQTVTKLGLGQITNVGQSISTMLKTNPIVTIMAMGDALGPNRKSAKEFTQMTGEILESSMDEFNKQAGGEMPLVKKFLSKIGFSASERFNRIVAANAGKRHAQYLADQLLSNPNNKVARRALERLDIDADTVIRNGGLDKSQLITAAQKVVEDTQFKTEKFDLPYLWTSPYGKILTQFKSFAFKQSQFITKQSKVVAKEAMQGNLRPFANMMIVGGIAAPIAGEMINGVKSIIRNKERKEGAVERYINDVFTTLSLGLFSDVGTLVTGKYGMGGTISTLAGPTASQGYNLITAGQSLFQDRKSLTGTDEFVARVKPMTRELLKMIPVLGTTLSNTFVPNDSVDAYIGINQKEEKEISQFTGESNMGLKLFGFDFAGKANAADTNIPMYEEDAKLLYENDLAFMKSFREKKAAIEYGKYDTEADRKKALDEFYAKTDYAMKRMNATVTRFPEIRDQLLKENYGFDKFKEIKGDDAISNYQRTAEAYKISNKIVDDMRVGGLSADQTVKMLSDLGITEEDAAYYYMASQNQDIRADMIRTAIAENGNEPDRNGLINSLIELRREVNGKMVLQNAIIDDLYNDDLITKSERDVLKAIEYEDGKPRIKKSSGLGSGSGSKSKTASKAMGTALVNASKATRKALNTPRSSVKQKDYSNYKPAKVVPVNASRASMPTPKIKLRKVSK